MRTMKAAVYVRPSLIELADKPIPVAGPGSVVVKITTTTICGTDVHILKGEYPVDAGRAIGHEPVGVIAEIGAGVEVYTVGQRVIVGAITPCGHATPASTDISPNAAAKRQAAGALATPSMAARPNTRWSRMQWAILNQFQTG